VTPGGAPGGRQLRSADTPGPSPGGRVRFGLGITATARPPRPPGVHESDQRGRRPTYGPPVTTAPISSPPGPRFLTLDQVAEELQVTRSQVYALVRGRSLAAVKIGGRGQWRVERSRLEDYIAGLYRQAETDDPADLPADQA